MRGNDVADREIVKQVIVKRNISNMVHRRCNEECNDWWSHIEPMMKKGSRCMEFSIAWLQKVAGSERTEQNFDFESKRSSGHSGIVVDYIGSPQLSHWNTPKLTDECQDGSEACTYVFGRRNHHKCCDCTPHFKRTRCGALKACVCTLSIFGKDELNQ